MSDLLASAEGVSIWTDGKLTPDQFDLAVIATGHVWPDEDTSPRDFFPSPWSG